MASAAVAIRERVMAAGARIKRVKRLDRLATVFITLGGIFIVVSVSFIFLFIFGQALPLFRSADGPGDGCPDPGRSAAPRPRAGAPGGAARRSASTSTRCTSTSCCRTAGSRSSRRRTAPSRASSRCPRWPGATVTAALAQPARRLRRRGHRRRPRGAAAGPLRPALRGAAPGRPGRGGPRPRGASSSTRRSAPVRRVAYQERESWQAVAAQVARRRDRGLPQEPGRRRPSSATPCARRERRARSRPLALGRTDTLAAGTETGGLYSLGAGRASRAWSSHASPPPTRPITAL